MNLASLPALHWPHGLALHAGLVGLSTLAVAAWFRRAMLSRPDAPPLARPGRPRRRSGLFDLGGEL